MARGYYDDMKKLNDDQYIVAWFLEAARSGMTLTKSRRKSPPANRRWSN